MSRFWLVTLFVFSYLLCLVLSVPLARYLPPLLPQGISVTGIQGNLLKGSAKTVRLNNQPVENLNWQLDLRALLSFQPTLEITARTQGIDIYTRATGHLLSTDITLEKTRVSASLQDVLAPYQLLLDINGNSALTLAPLSLREPCESLEGKLTLDTLNSTSLPVLAKLENLTGQLSCQQNTLTLTLPIKQTLLKGDLVFSVSEQARYHTRINLNSPDPEVKGLLQNLIGPSNRKGEFYRVFRGRLHL
ncbi:MAG: type II secretion system protein N [Pontibacterium sp.]